MNTHSTRVRRRAIHHRDQRPRRLGPAGEVLAIRRRLSCVKAEYRAAQRNLRHARRCPGTTPERLAAVDERYFATIYAVHAVERDLLAATGRDPDAKVSIEQPSSRFGDDAFGAFLEREHASAAAFVTSARIAEREILAAGQRLPVRRESARRHRQHSRRSTGSAATTGDPDPEPDGRPRRLSSEASW
jgi:hypothetical protein